MSFNAIILKKKSAIQKAWSDALMAPTGASVDFREKQRALFAESMGYDMEEGIEWLFDALLKGTIPDDVSQFLEGIIRIRAESGFTASQAVAFIIEAKNAVRKELGNEVLSDPRMREELSAWGSFVDDLILHAFDIYARYRENVLDANAKKEREETLRLLRRAKLIPDE
jgi:hypothetical protein